ncbi:hypothetical protein [Vibrio navarrensis]|uniref:hypothetical protein n=1 Tax=Vibrio navarrensis TaxID=29495 RepID=UPI002095A776|nr:hypothetical protein [Vibrio navarrensis]
MPILDKQPERVMSFEFLDHYDVYQLAGISQQLNHKQSANFDFWANQKSAKEIFKSEIIGYFHKRSDSLGGLRKTPESRVKHIAFDVLSLSDMRFLFSKDHQLIIFIFIRIVINSPISPPPEISPSTVSDINSILNYLANSLISSQVDIEKKRALINELIEAYYRSSEEFKFNWIDDDDDEQITWATDYFSKIPTVKGIINRVPNVMKINENNKVILAAIFHSLRIGNAEKKLLMMNFKRAWSQKKYREKTTKENKKTLNIVVD